MRPSLRNFQAGQDYDSVNILSDGTPLYFKNSKGQTIVAYEYEIVVDVYRNSEIYGADADGSRGIKISYVDDFDIDSIYADFYDEKSDISYSISFLEDDVINKEDLYNLITKSID